MGRFCLFLAMAGGVVDVDAADMAVDIVDVVDYGVDLIVAIVGDVVDGVVATVVGDTAVAVKIAEVVADDLDDAVDTIGVVVASAGAAEENVVMEGVALEVEVAAAVEMAACEAHEMVTEAAG